MKDLSDKEVGLVSGAAYDPWATGPRIYAGGYYNSSSDYGANLGAGYNWNLGGGSYLNTSVTNNIFSSAGNSSNPTYGLSYTFRF